MGKHDLSLIAYERIRSEDNVLKDELRRVGSAHSTLIFNSLSEGEARCAFLHQEERDVGPLLSSPCVNEKDISEFCVTQSAVSDPHFVTIKDPVAVAVLDGLLRVTDRVSIMDTISQGQGQVRVMVRVRVRVRVRVMVRVRVGVRVRVRVRVRISVKVSASFSARVSVSVSARVTVRARVR